MATKELSNTVLQLEKKVKIRLHKPRLSKVLDLLRSSPAEGTVDEEAPGEIKGLVSGDIAERDPDARPPENLVQYFVKYFSSQSHPSAYLSGRSFARPQLIILLRAFIRACIQRNLWQLVVRMSCCTFLLCFALLYAALTPCCLQGALVVLVTLPQYFDSTARFYYYNRGLWVSIMTVFTFQRWAGDVSSSRLGTRGSSLTASSSDHSAMVVPYW